MKKNDYDIIIVGAGIVGLASALSISDRDPSRRLLIVDKEHDVARHQTGHNSGVIHSGIYYRPGSLKAHNCVQGYRQLLTFCDENDVPYEICGKVIVAVNEEEVARLDTLQERGAANGLTGLRRLSRRQLTEAEPHVSGKEGLLVPQTGIIDFAAVAGKMAEILKGRGVDFRMDTLVEDIRQKADATEVITPGAAFTARAAVTCAGLFSDRLGRMTDPGLPVRIIPFRGEYHILKQESRHLVRSLIYPVPDPSFPFLGVHFTRMLDGRVEAGPNAVLALKREGYGWSDISLGDVLDTLRWPGFIRLARANWRMGLGEVHRSISRKAFVSSLRKLVPSLRVSDLESSGAGVRAQACDRQGRLLDDFFFRESRSVIHVLNAPSPAATSCLAIGEVVADRVLK